jgi:hypothetical protein
MAPEHYMAEDLCEPFYFNRPTRVSDGAGGFTTTVARNPVGSGFHFAKVRPLRGTERVLADGLVATQSLMFVVYAALGILPTDTLVYNGVSYNIRSVNPATAQSVFQEIEAVAGEVL